MPCTLCRHRKSDGLRCRAIALRQNDYCYFHDRLHVRRSGNRPLARRPASLRYDESFEMQPPVDRASILLGVWQTEAAVDDKRISRQRAAVLLTGLKLAAKVAAMLPDPSEP